MQLTAGNTGNSYSRYYSEAVTELEAQVADERSSIYQEIMKGTFGRAAVGVACLMPAELWWGQGAWAFVLIAPAVMRGAGFGFHFSVMSLSLMLIRVVFLVSALFQLQIGAIAAWLVYATVVGGIRVMFDESKIGKKFFPDYPYKRCEKGPLHEPDLALRRY